MATPTFEITETIDTNTGTTGMVGNYPATVTAGNLLIIVCTYFDDAGFAVVASDADGTITGPLISGGGAGNNDCGISCWKKTATGNESGGTIDFLGDLSDENGVIHVIQISGWGGTLADDVDVSVLTGADTTSTPNPASVTAGWGSDTNLFLAIFAWRSGGDPLTAAPTNYTIQEQGVSADVGLGTTSRALEAASDDPGAGTLTGSADNQCFTLVIKPAASAAAKMTNYRARFLNGVIQGANP